MRGLTNQPRVLGRTLSVAVILFKPTRVSEFVEYSAFPPTSTLDRCIPMPSFWRTHFGVLRAENPCERRFLARSTVARQEQLYCAAV